MRSCCQGREQVSHSDEDDDDNGGAATHLDGIHHLLWRHRLERVPRHSEALHGLGVANHHRAAHVCWLDGAMPKVLRSVARQLVLGLEDDVSAQRRFVHERLATHQAHRLIT